MAPLLAQPSGVDRAFERLYRRHAVDVYRYALAVLRNQADAEDVTQTTFMNAYRALERGDTPKAPHNWLIAIAHNVCRQRFRQAARRVQEVGLEDDVADHFVRPEDDDTPTPADIRRALGHLAFNQRAALVMRELEGRSYAEIADLLELSVSAVETLIFRARRALREQLDGSLTCGQAEQLLSCQLDGELTKSDRGQLRAHLRECDACRRLARSQRAQRSALRALGSIPLPSSLASLFGGGASVGTAVAVKAAAVVVTAGVVGGLGYDVHHALVPTAPKQRGHAAVAHTQPVTAPERQRAVSHLPAVAAVVAPVHVRRRHPAPARHAVPQPRRQPAAPPLLEQPQAPPAAPAQPAPPVRPGAAPKDHGRGRAHSQGKGQSQTKGKGKGHRAEQPQPGGSAPPADTSGPPSSQPRGNSGESPGNASKPPGQDALPITAPEVPVTVPVPAPDGLTQTSQKSSARIDPVRHLLP